MTTQQRPTTISYWAWLLLAALVIRIAVAFVLFGSISQVSDALSYANQARHFISGEGCGREFFWPIGRALGLLPFFLVFGVSDAVVKANSIMFDVGCVLAAGTLAHQVLRTSSTARLAGWIAAFYPPIVLTSGWSYSSNVTMFALLSTMCLALAACRNRERGLISAALWFVSGCLLGYAMLTRPSVQSVFIFGLFGGIGLLAVRWLKPSWVSWLGTLSWKSVLASMAVFTLGAGCCIVPVMRHHASLGAGWTLSTNNEKNFFLGNNRFTPHYKTWHWGQHNPPKDVKSYFSSLYSQENPRRAMMQEALRYIASRPDIFFLRTANRFRAFWGFDYMATGKVNTAWPNCGKPLLLSIFCVEGGGYCLLMLFVIAGLFLFPNAMDARYAILLSAVVIAYMLPYLIAFSCGTYHFPIIGFLFPFAAVGIHQAWLGKNGGWPDLIRSKWFWAAIAGFSFIQLEYVYFVYSFLQDGI